MSDATHEMTRIEELRQRALEQVRSENFDEALLSYDEALALATDEEVHELITIHKADALIALGRSGPEVQALPMILMRRPNARHTFLAAYALTYKHRLANEIKRAIFYGQIAVDAAAASTVLNQGEALNELGIAYETDSQFEKAIECFSKALACLNGAQTTDAAAYSFLQVAIMGNLGYNKLLVGETVAGIQMLEEIIDQVKGPSDLSDCYVALCYGYLDLEQFEKARALGEKGLELATQPREVRNAHYLVGEAAYKSGDLEVAEYHFEQLARFYPQFRHLKSLLFAIDLRSMINLKL
jgi:tetratricopeptide (TPR) repeat protein